MIRVRGYMSPIVVRLVYAQHDSFTASLNIAARFFQSAYTVLTSIIILISYGVNAKILLTAPGAWLLTHQLGSYKFRSPENFRSFSN